MRVNTNSTALSASIELDFNEQVINKLSEQLASGQRLNHASDDPSGLAISQNILAQANGANQGVQNMQDTVSLLQTAEGGMRSIVDAIQRIRVLALQAANDTYTDNQRQQMQQEVDQLKQHIDQVAKTTQFNTINLLEGSFDVQFVPTGLNLGDFLPDSSLNFDIGFQQLTVSVTPFGASSSNGYDASLRVRNLGPLRDTNLTVLQRLLTNINGAGSGVSASLVADSSGQQHALRTNVTPSDSQYSFIDGGGGTLAAVAGLNNVSVAQSGQYLTVQAGANSGDTIPLLIPNMSVAALGLSGIAITSTTSAEDAIPTLDQAVQSVSGDLSVLGAGENRLTQGSGVESNTNLMLTRAFSGIVDANMPQALSQFATHQLEQSVAESAVTQAIHTNYGLSLLTVSGLKQRFPLLAAHMGG